MSLFSEKTLQGYVDSDYSAKKKLIDKRYENFKNFQLKKTQIPNWKETDYQTEFLQDIFENCLGYISKTQTTNPNYTLEREKKNQTNAQKADGALLVDGKVIAVIELKDQKTQDLDKKYNRDESAVKQAFGYLVHNDSAKYVIVSNFNELRFYFDKATDYERFYLFDLDFEGFKKLHSILSYESLKDGLPLTIKTKSSTAQQDISNKFYKDYTAFRTSLFDNILNNNQNIDNVKLLSVAQKLIDRIIFMLFAEDSNLIPSNTINQLIANFENQVTRLPLYDFYKIYFNAINQGDSRLKIDHYNGGLFAPDALLDNLSIDDGILNLQVKKLASYDFKSDVSVNILGHIFENSISELEEITAKLQDQEYDAKQSKRKKDGVFYTPEYITRYIVENTIGTLCNQKREELKITNVIAPRNSKRLTNEEQEIKDNLSVYKNWILNLKILDPACGSGAFLNQALDFLIKEHISLQNDFALMGDLFSVYEIEKEVLEHNLYGVDINESAVEIARLSLWLRTAQKGRKLTSLAEKIKVGNSLISDQSVVDNAFDWEQEFPEVFKQGGFDVVIGNPPYVRVQGLKSNYEDESKLYEAKFVSATGKYDLYALFMEQSFKMLNQKGKLSYILPHKFLISDFGSGLRGFLVENKAVESLLHFGSEMVFEDASTYTCIITLSHNNEKLNFKSISPKDIFHEFDYDSIGYEKLGSDKWNLSNNDISKVLEKINQQPFTIKDLFQGIFQGIKTGDDKIFILNGIFDDNYFIGYSNKLNKEIKIEKDILKPILKGKDIKKYAPLNSNLYIIYPHKIDEKLQTKPYEENILQDLFPLTYEYLLNFKDELIEKKNKYKTNPEYWYSLHRARDLNLINQEKILTPDISYKSNMSLDNLNSCHIGQYNLIKKDNILEEHKFYLTIFNSELMWFFIKNTSNEFRGGFFVYQTNFLESFPLPKLEILEQQNPFIQKADLMLELNKKLQITKQNFYDELGLEKLTTKLQNFEELEFDDFIKEYTKSKKIKFADKLEERNFKNAWIALFEKDKKEVLNLQNQINQTDKEINQMVYELYDLTEDEINIVEGKSTGSN